MPPLHIEDFGPLYFETLSGRLPVEPWNTYSNLIFLFIVIYFTRLCNRDIYKYPLITVSLPILLVGFVGGTLFHATRSNQLWLLLDFIPIIALGFLATIYLWEAVVGKIYAIPLTLLLLAAPRLLLWELNLPRGIIISTSYGVLGSAILVPAFIVSKKHGWVGLSNLVTASISFPLALFARTWDMRGAGRYLPMGSHFIWHLLGGLSVFLLMSFVYKLDSIRAKK